MKMTIPLALAVCAAVCAEPPSETRRYNANFHGFGVFGACQHGYGLFGGGGGAEGLLWKGISLGVDASYQVFTDGWGFGMLTPQFGYHFVNRDKPLRWDPFITIGAGMGFMSGGATGAGNFGGGFNYWFKPRMALRVEFRTHAIGSGEGEFVATGRVGLSFR